MLKVQTTDKVRANPNPVFVALASSDQSATISVFRDPKKELLFMAQANDSGKAFSPITGKECEALSVGEIASGPVKDLQSIGKCTKRKCGCTIYSSPSIAALLETAKEKTVFCTACGTEMALAIEHAEGDEDEEEDDEDVVVDEEDDDAVGDDEEVTDEDGDPVMEDDEEVVDEEDVGDDEEVVDDESPEDDEDEEDDVSDAEVAKLVAEVAAMEDDTDDSTNKPAEDKVDDKPKEGEEADADATAKAAKEAADKLAQDAADAQPSDVTLAYAMHKLSDLSKGKTRVLFVDTDTAYLAHAAEGAVERHLGTFSRLNATPESAKLYDNRPMFGKVVKQFIQSGALAGEQPTDEIAGLGFKSIMLELPLTVAQAKLTEEAKLNVEKAAREETASAVKDVSENFAKLVAIAAVGLDKGVLGKISFHKELASLLHSVGVRKASTVARDLCEAKFKPYMQAVIDEATALAGKDANYVAGLAESVGKAAYPTTDNPVPSTALADDSNEEDVDNDVVVASLEDHRERQKVPVSNISSALRRIGRGR